MSTQLSQHSARTHTPVFSGLATATVSSSVLASDWSPVARHVLKFCHDWFLSHNPRRRGEVPVNFHDVPFVKDFLSVQSPLPLYLLLSEDQAALLIQAFWRGYKMNDQRVVKEEWFQLSSSIKSVTGHV
ncbi:IQ domain-containing protein K [Liparis tanakae]|uniref:IQ domain-containing protein K n=1 Tax=Liparis tanakae TaxID=230148 RepID=A0A4Z2J5L6_9TELE|nr:IQ domain-containing protein K [Liparis tanakae]